MKNKYLIGLIISFSALTSLPTMAEDKPIGFIVNSVGSGKGGDLGGLEGADAHCTKLAKAAGDDKREWRAYLSTEAGGKRGISARDRIEKILGIMQKVN